MLKHVRRFRWPLALFAAVFVLATFAVPARASLVTTNFKYGFWDWDHSWSGWRLIMLLPVLTVLLWLWCFHFVFLHRYLRRRKPPLWPLEGFYRALGWFIFLFCAVFVLLFAGLSDELCQNQWYILPSWLSWLDRNWPWILILTIGAGVGFVVAYAGRHPAAKAPAQPSD